MCCQKLDIYKIWMVGPLEQKEIHQDLSYLTSLFNSPLFSLSNSIIIPSFTVSLKECVLLFDEDM